MNADAPALARPLWLIALAYAGLATLAICWPAWPGQMTYDPLYAYETSITGIQHMIWPPMHAYLFWISRMVGAGAGGLFAAQTFVLFFAAAVSASLLVRARALAVAAMLAFAAAFVAVPPMLGVALSQWRDVTTGSFAMLSLALWLLAARRRSHWLMAAAAAALGCAVSLRYNAFPLFVLIAPLMVWRPFLAPRPAARDRIAMAALLILAIGLAWASTQWRLPDFKRMPPPGTTAQIQLFDLMGVSACADRNFLPPGVTGGRPITPAQIRAAYDPRHSQMAHREISTAPRILATDAGGEVQRAWRRVIPQHLGCYIAHRNAVLVEQLGMARRDVFYPAHGGIDRNEHGLELAHPNASYKVTAYVQRNAKELWRRPALLYLFAACVVGLLAVRGDRRAPFAAAVLGGAFANVGLLYLIGPAADARYIFPSNVLCALLIAAGVAMLIEGPGLSSARGTR